MKDVDSANVNTGKDGIFISPEAVFKSFQAEVSSDYIRTLAEDFAEKAAAHFMTIISKSHENKVGQNKLPSKSKLRSPKDTKAKLKDPPVINKKTKHLVNKEEVLTLLRHPSMDGDYIEQTLSDEVTEPTEGNTVRLKINGAYYKRHNLAVNQHGSTTEMPSTTKLIEATDITTTEVTKKCPSLHVVHCRPANPDGSTTDMPTTTKLIEALRTTDIITTEKPKWTTQTHTK